MGATSARSILSVVHKVDLDHKRKIPLGSGWSMCLLSTGFTSTSLSAQAVTQGSEDMCGRGAISGAHKDDELRVLVLTLI